MTVLSMQELLRKYDGAVPRYTSYPTAPHFRHTVTQTDYRALLQEIPESQSVSLYIHIPFCRHLCFYCGCHTKVVDHDAPLREYLGVVKQEIALAAAALGRRQKVSHIHFGGGTPNFAATDDLYDLLKTVSERFDLAEDAVIAMEMDPRILDEKKTHELVKLGVNRVSLGVQDFQPDVQEAVNRIQPYAHVENCVRWLRDAGVTSINFDMIYGLPLQTSDKIHDNMEKLKTLRPDRVALFGYAHVPWFKSHQKKLEAYPLPDTAERFAMAELARQDLIAAGYTPIGIDHFALPTDELAIALKEKRLHRNFQGYTADPDTALISFGQTSISQYNNAYVQNTDRNRDYRDTVLKGEFPLAKACLLSPEDIYRRAVIEAVMCYGAVDLKTLDGANLWAESAWTAALPALTLLAEDGLVTLGDRNVTVTKTGRVFTRLIASAFDAYLQQPNKETGTPRHAKTI